MVNIDYLHGFESNILTILLKVKTLTHHMYIPTVRPLKPLKHYCHEDSLKSIFIDWD